MLKHCRQERRKTIVNIVRKGNRYQIPVRSFHETVL
jgi:hypothetical protein